MKKEFLIEICKNLNIKVSFWDSFDSLKSKISMVLGKANYDYHKQKQKIEFNHNKMSSCVFNNKIVTDKSIYDDIYFFASQGTMKSVYQLEDRLRKYNIPFKTIKANTVTVAFELQNLRIPEKGFLRIEF